MTSKDNAMEQRPECPSPSGIIVLVGGKEDKDPKKIAEPDSILETVCKLRDKSDSAVIVVTSGSKEPNSMYPEYQKAFSALGCSHLVHIHHDDRAAAGKDTQSLSDIQRAGIVYFAGGDQLMLTSLYGGSPFLTQLKEKYIKGNIVIAGTSAGAMALSTPMIYAGNQDVQQVSGEIKVTTGLEFMKDVCVDTHFVHRNRFIRLAQVIATNPSSTGLGIEEDTAVIIRNGQQAEVIGSGTVIRMEGFNIIKANMDSFTEKKPVSIQNLKVDIYAPGDKFTIEQRNPQHK